MQEIQKVFDSISKANQFKQIHIETIIQLYLTDENIEPDEFFKEIERFSNKINQPYSVIKMKFEKLLNKEFSRNPEALSHKSDIFTIEDMKKPWEITEKMGYMVFQDINSTKNSFFIKSFDRIGDEKFMTTKTDEKSLIALLNSWAYEQNIKWNKPIKQNGVTISISEELVDFKDADLTRFSHIEIVFDPSTSANATTWQKRDCLNSYTAPKILDKKRKNDVSTSWPLELADFFRIIWNLVNHHHDAQLYVIQWLAKNYQTKKYAQTILWFAGESGTGKGLLVDILINIYGDRYVGKGGAKRNIFNGNDNSELKNKLYYHADEVKVDGEIWEEVKLIAANSTFTLKALYENQRKYPNFASFIFNSNMRPNQIPFKINTDDERRLSIFESHLPLRKEKWVTHIDTLSEKCKNDEVFADGVAQFLADMEYNSSFVDIPFDNEIRRRMLEAGKPNMERFSEALAHKDLDWFINQGIETFDWIRTDGKKAVNYTWLDHLLEAFENDYIPTISCRELYKLIFDDIEYKKETLLDNKFTEATKRVDIDNTKKPRKVFQFPSYNTIDDEEDTFDVEIELDMNIINGVDSSTNPPKKTGIRNLKKIGGKR